MPDPTDPRPLVWLVEDNPADVYLLREALRDACLDCELRVLEDGEKALHAIDAPDVTPPDLVLLDLNLPRFNGRQVLQRIRESEVLGRTRVVVLTSSDWSRDRDDALRLGADGFHRKPASLDRFLELGGVIRELVERR